jgi:hypothetical protein
MAGEKVAVCFFLQEKQNEGRNSNTKYQWFLFWLFFFLEDFKKELLGK